MYSVILSVHKKTLKHSLRRSLCFILSQSLFLSFMALVVCVNSESKAHTRRSSHGGRGFLWTETESVTLGLKISKKTSKEERVSNVSKSFVCVAKTLLFIRSLFVVRSVRLLLLLLKCFLTHHEEQREEDSTHTAAAVVVGDIVQTSVVIFSTYTERTIHSNLC